MKQRTGGGDEEIVATIVLAVIVFGIVIGGAVYTQAQLDAAAQIPVGVEAAQPQADVHQAQRGDEAAFEVRQARHRVVPAGRIALR